MVELVDELVLGVSAVVEVSVALLAPVNVQFKGSRVPLIRDLDLANDHELLLVIFVDLLNLFHLCLVLGKIFIDHRDFLKAVLYSIEGIDLNVLELSAFQLNDLPSLPLLLPLFRGHNLIVKFFRALTVQVVKDRRLHGLWASPLHLEKQVELRYSPPDRAKVRLEVDVLLLLLLLILFFRA